MNKISPMKISLVKYALAAILAVPAVSTFATTSTNTHAKYRHSHRHVVLVSSKHRHHAYHHTHSKHTKLSSRHHRHTSLSSHVRSSNTGRPTVSVSHMPPTIDGMGA
jgi:hypothetical protein